MASANQRRVKLGRIILSHSNGSQMVSQKNGMGVRDRTWCGTKFAKTVVSPWETGD